MRIEFKDVEQKMADLRGYCRTYFDDDKNPYTTDLLTDDEFNFVSGINYALSYLTDLEINNLDELTMGGVLEKNEFIKNCVEQIGREVIEDFAERGYSDLSEIITSFIENHEEEEQ